MKKMHVMGLVGASILSLATSAWAGFWSNYTKIDSLYTAPDGYVITPTSAINNPANCANTDRVYGYSASPAAEKEQMDKTLLSAFLANRKVRLNVAASVCSSGGYPVYISVGLDSAQ